MSSYDLTLLPNRIRSKFVVDSSGCWLWTAAHDRGGYGRSYMNGKLILAHRLTYELLVGPIPKGLVIDHLCGNPPCVNPSHLEPVTHRENTQRWYYLHGMSRHNSKKTHCLRGHEYTVENTLVSYWHERKRRRCRICVNTQLRESRSRAREKTQKVSV